MAVSGGVRRPLALADSCHPSAADPETLAGVMSVVLTASRNVVYVFCKQRSPLVGRVLESGRRNPNFDLSCG